MATRCSQFAGMSVAMTTPFQENGEIDFGRLEEQVEFQIEAGESPTLSHEEHREVIRAVVKAAAGRIKVMAGTGSNSTAEAIELTKFAEKNGADAALLVGPYYNKPMQEGFYQHFKAVASSVGIPLCVYNIPGRTGKAIDAETIIRLAEIKNIGMVKEATGSMDNASKILAATDLTILSGDDSLTLPFMSLGAEGAVSVIGNFIPREATALCKAVLEGRLEEARALHRRLFPLCRDMLSLATNPIPVKAALALLGRDTGKLRLPLTPLDEPSMTKLKKSLADFGLL